jgi:hypothetical protein
MPEKLKTLLELRGQLLNKLKQIGDMRQGYLHENYRSCGKPNCWCAKPGHKGHGPYYIFTRKVGGKTKTINMRPGARLDKIKGEVEEYQRFKHICRQLVEVNERICEARPVEEYVSVDAVRASLKKKRQRSRSKKTRK